MGKIVKLFAVLTFIAAAETSVEDRMRVLERRLSSLEAENDALKFKLQLSDGLVGEIRMFGLNACPPGWQEVTNAQGRIPVFRPTGTQALQMFGTPLKPNETLSVPPHSHTATVNDPGHDHQLPIVSILCWLTYTRKSHAFAWAGRCSLDEMCGACST